MLVLHIHFASTFDLESLTYNALIPGELSSCSLYTLNIKVKDQLVQKLEWKHTKAYGWTDTTDRFTFLGKADSKKTEENGGKSGQRDY